MIDILKDLPLTFIPLFVAMDPVGILPIFMSITNEMTYSERQSIIKYSIVTALAVSLVFVAVGEGIFRILGITVDDFKIAGGLLLLILAVIELIGRSEEHKKPHDVGVVPIGVPLLVGPAVLTTLIVLIDHYGVVPTVISLLLNLILVYVIFTGAQNIIKLIGRNGIIAISKIVALFLAAIAVMMIRIGIESYLKV
jgi:multiple antibiotic resistance protein